MTVKQLITLTFGKGNLDFNGFWEFPCDACERAYQNRVARKEALENDR